jgi:hypothetical protein
MTPTTMVEVPAEVTAVLVAHFEREHAHFAAARSEDAEDRRKEALYADWAEQITKELRATGSVNLGSLPGAPDVDVTPAAYVSDALESALDHARTAERWADVRAIADVLVRLDA